MKIKIKLPSMLPELLVVTSLLIMVLCAAGAGRISCCFDQYNRPEFRFDEAQTGIKIGVRETGCGFVFD
jgi:hypothetical protein